MNNVPDLNIQKKIFSLLTVLGLYTFGNFGFLNVFNIKYEVYFITLISLVCLSVFSFFINIRKVILDPLLLIYIYLSFSSLFIVPFEYTFTMKMLVIVFVFIYLLSMELEYIDFIVKGSIVITFIFSVVGICLFIYYQFNPDLLVDMDRVYRSYDKFVDLSNIPIHQKFGFVIEVPENNLFSISYIRSRSFFSEPSATVPLFFTIGILSYLYSLRYKIIGSIILFYSIVLIYSGSVILSLIISFLLFCWLFLFNPDSRVGSVVVILSIFLIISFIFFVDLSMLSYITPDAKITSMPSRVSPIIKEVENILLYPFYKKEYQTNSFLGLAFLYLGAFPFLGLVLCVSFFYKVFNFLISCFNKYTLFSALAMGLMVQIIFFSSNGWLTPTGSIILCLLWRKIEQINTIKLSSDNVIV